MNTSLSNSATQSLLGKTAIPQRYGLSIMPRKSWPDIATLGKQSATPRAFSVDGHAVLSEQIWENLPGDLRERVRSRVVQDPLFALHVLRSPSVTVARVAGTSVPLVLRKFLFPGVSQTLVLQIEPNADVTVIEEPVTADPETSGQAFGSAALLLSVGAGARVRWFSSTENVTGHMAVERLAVLTQDASLELFSAQLAPKLMRDDVTAYLVAPGASVNVRTLVIGAQDTQSDLGITALHEAPRTSSDLRARVVLGGKAQAIVRGLVRVEKQAIGSSGYQRCDALLLSPQAEVDPIPNLEIETDDVRCTHGVTVSHLNADQRFYLQSRGLSVSAADRLLIDGFTQDIVRDYPAELRPQLHGMLTNVVQTLV